jgi:HEAT repeat protein
MRFHHTWLVPLILATACLASFGAAKKAGKVKAPPAASSSSPPSEEKLWAVLTSHAAAGEKCNACRELQTIATEKSIPVLAGLLTDAEISHTARVALETMPYPAAGAALREAAGKTSGLVKSGILDSLGQRRDAQSLPLLAAALEDKDVQVVAAAAIALGRIGTSDAAQALTAARAKAPGKSQILICDGLLVCADRLLVAGQREAALKIYAVLSQPGQPAAVRAGALRGQMRAVGGNALLQLLRDSLASQDAQVRAAAAGELRNLTTVELRLAAAGMATLPASSQVAILAAIRLRGDKSLAPIALKAAIQVPGTSLPGNASDPSVRIAAVAALGTVGDAGALPLLISLTSEQGAHRPPRETSAGLSSTPTTLAVDDPLAAAAWQSLLILSGPNVDEGILAAMRAEKDPARCIQWIEVVESRRPRGLVPALLGLASGASEDVGARAMEALRKMAGPKDLPAMVDVLLKLDNGPARDQAEIAVALVCQQNPDRQHRADPLLEIFRGKDQAQRNELLPLVGRIGGTAASRVIQEGLAGNDPQTREAAFRGLCNWPDDAVADQLLQLSQTAKDEAARRLALRALVRVSVLGAKPDAEKLARLKKAMDLAQSDEDRQWVLKRAAAVRCVETLRFLLPYLDKPALAEQAGASVVDLAWHKELRNPHKKEFVPALKKVLATNHDGQTLSRAQRCLSE